MAAGPNYNLIGAGSFSGGAFTAPLLGANGSAAAPTYGFTGATNYGWYYDSTNSTLAASANGLEAFQIGRDAATGNLPFASFGGTPVAGNAFTVRGQTSDSSAYAFRIETLAGGTIATARNNGSWLQYGSLGANSNGNAANPAILLGTVQNSGMFSDGSNLRLSSNAVLVASWNATQQVSGLKPATASKTTNYTVLAADTFTQFDNFGAAGAVTFTLPAAAVGMTFVFGAVAAQQILVTASAADSISMVGNSKANGGTITGPAATQGACVTITCTSANHWLVTAFTGTWT